MLRRIAATVLLILLAIALVACQSASPTPAPAGNDPAPAADASVPTAADEPADDVPAAPETDDIAELTWIIVRPGTEPTNWPQVEEVLNALSGPAVGVHMTQLYMDNDQVQLALNSGEYFDIVFTCSWYNNYMTQSRNGLFADITDMVQTVTPELYALVPPTVWKGSEVDGRIYAVPTYKDTAATQYWQFDKAFYVDEQGVDITQYNTFDSIEGAFQIYKEANPDLYPLMLGQDGLNGLNSNYNMINPNSEIGIPYSEDGTATANTVYCTFDHPDYIARLTKLHEWYEAGYINPDAPSIQSNSLPRYSAIKSGQGFEGAEAIWSSENGYEIVIQDYYGPVLSTASIQGSMNAISVASDHIEKALCYIEYINTNRDYRDHLRYGIQGENWEYVNDGKSVQKLNSAYEPAGYAQATFFIMTPEFPVVAETWERVKAQNDTAAETANDALFGFAFDPIPVEASIAAIRTVVDKYRMGLRTGATDPAVELPLMMEEMRAAGIDDVVAECQRQVDEFITTYSN